MDARQFLDRTYTYAVVGASADPAKYGHRVFRDLVSAGFSVVPVNPKKPEVRGVPAVATLADIQPHSDVAVFIVPPKVGLKVMEEAAKLGIKKLWFQPGAESAAIRQRGTELGLTLMADGSCIMVERKLHRFV